MNKLRPRFFIVFRNEQQLKDLSFGDWTDPLRGAHFNNLSVIDGADDSDINFWHILRKRREDQAGYSGGPKTQIFSKIREEDV